jgi:AcrR family transcriptional regulator
MPVAARVGLANLALDVVSGRAGVTRNLLYHYFPRGRTDLRLAVLTEAEDQLNLAGTPDADPLPRMLDHALAPTHAWRIHRSAVAASDPELREVADRSVDALVVRLSSLQLATRDPEPLLRASLRAYVAFAETALDGGRAAALPRPVLLELLTQTLAATVHTTVQLARAPRG